MRLPYEKGEKVTGRFEDYFTSYTRIKYGDILIHHPSMPQYLTRCPVNITPEYVIDNIEEKGFLFWKRMYVTIEKL